MILSSLACVLCIAALLRTTEAATCVVQATSWVSASAADPRCSKFHQKGGEPGGSPSTNESVGESTLVPDLPTALSKDSDCDVVELCENAVYDIEATVNVCKNVQIKSIASKGLSSSPATSTPPAIVVKAQVAPAFNVVMPWIPKDTPPKKKKKSTGDATENDKPPLGVSIIISGITIDATATVVGNTKTASKSDEVASTGAVFDVACQTGVDNSSLRCADEESVLRLVDVKLAASVAPATLRATAFDPIVAQPIPLIRWQGAYTPTPGDDDGRDEGLDPRLHLLRVDAILSANADAVCDIALGGYCTPAYVALAVARSARGVLVEALTVQLTSCDTVAFQPRVVGLWAANASDLLLKGSYLQDASLVHAVSPVSRLHIADAKIVYSATSSFHRVGSSTAAAITLSTAYGLAMPPPKDDTLFLAGQVQDVFVEGVAVAGVPPQAVVIHSSAANLSCVRIHNNKFELADVSSTAFVFPRGVLQDVLITKTHLAFPCNNNDDDPGKHGSEVSDYWPRCEKVPFPPSPDVDARWIGLFELMQQQVRIPPWHLTRDSLLVHDKADDPQHKDPKRMDWGALCERGKIHRNTDAPPPPPPPTRPPPSEPVTPPPSTSSGGTPSPTGAAAGAEPPASFINRAGGYLIGGVAMALLVGFVIFGSVLIRRRAAALRHSGVESGSDWDRYTARQGPEDPQAPGGDDPEEEDGHSDPFLFSRSHRINASDVDDDADDPRQSLRSRITHYDACARSVGPNSTSGASRLTAANIPRNAVAAPPLSLRTPPSSGGDDAGASRGGKTTGPPHSSTTTPVLRTTTPADNLPSGVGQQTHNTSADPRCAGADAATKLDVPSARRLTTGRAAAAPPQRSIAAGVDSGATIPSSVAGGTVYFPPCYTQTEVESLQDAATVRSEESQRPRVAARTAYASSKQRQIKARLETALDRQAGGSAQLAAGERTLNAPPRSQQPASGAAAAAGTEEQHPGPVVSTSSEDSSWDMRSSQYTTASERSIASNS